MSRYLHHMSSQGFVRDLLMDRIAATLDDQSRLPSRYRRGCDLYCPRRTVDLYMTIDQQRLWADERASRNLTRGHERFAATGLMQRLDEPRLLVTILPADPAAPTLDLEDDLLQMVPDRFTGRTANSVGFLGGTAVTDDTVARVAVGGNAGMRAYAAIRRAGAVEVGIGSTIRYGLGDGNSRRYGFRLHSIVHAIRVVVESQARLCSYSSLAETLRGPFELIAALPETEGAVLGGLADGWEPPHFGLSDDMACLTSDVLVRMQLDKWPGSREDQETTTVRMADRVCNAFGTLQRLFAPPHGDPRAGQLSPDYA